MNCTRCNTPVRQDRLIDGGIDKHGQLTLITVYVCPACGREVEGTPLPVVAVLPSKEDRR